MKKKIILLLFSLSSAFILYSCFSKIYSPAMVDFIPPENAVLTVRDVRVKGFTLDWSDMLGDGYEYAIAASYNGNIGDYATALENNHVLLPFTPSKMLNGTYKATGLLPGQEYEIKLFVRAKNIKISEYLKAKASLPYIDDAEIYNIRINGEETEFDKTNDTFFYYYLPETEEDGKEYTFTYNLMRECGLYIDGERVENTEVPITPYENVEVTVVNEKTNAARDYKIYIGKKDNGIPIVKIDTEDGRRIDSKTRTVTARMQIIDSEYNPLGIGLYDGSIEIWGRGQSSWGMPKQSYSLELFEKSQILDMPPEKDWLLGANYADKSLIRSYLAYEFADDIGMAYAPRMRYVDLIVNGQYYGTYMLGERPRLSKSRLNFPKLTKDMTDEYELTGTYLLEISSLGRVGDDERTFTSPHVKPGKKAEMGDMVIIKQPSSNNLSQEAFYYIRDYFNAADEALFGDDFKDPEKGYRAYLDTASWIDWYLINELVKNVDGDFRLSTYIYKPRGDDKLYMGPVWDFDLAIGNADYFGCDNPEGWYVRNSLWHERLFEDEAFEEEFKDRWNYLKSNGYFERFFQRIDEMGEMLAKSAESNFQRWRILGAYVWPNANNPFERTTYQSEIDYLKEWLALRIEWMDKEINSTK